MTDVPGSAAAQSTPAPGATTLAQALFPGDHHHRNRGWQHDGHVAALSALHPDAAEQPNPANAAGLTRTEKSDHRMSEGTNATGLYRAVMVQVRRQINALGWPMWMCDERCGLPPGYTAKALHPDTSSGRQARWEQLEKFVYGLFGGEVNVVIRKKYPRP